MFRWNKIIEKDALMKIVSNDISFLNSMIEVFKQQVADTMGIMTRALEKNDKLALERVTHDLKNIGRSVACNRLIEHSQKLEKLILKDEITKAQIKETEKLFSKALKELNSIRDQYK